MTRTCKDCGKSFNSESSRARLCNECKEQRALKERSRKRRVCLICGKEFFYSRNSKASICNDKHPAVCCICGKEIDDSRKLDRDNIVCSKECGYKMQRKHIRETCLEKYGVTNPYQKPENIEKARQSSLEKYGTTCNLHSKQAEEKTKQTCLQRYGTEHPMQSDIVQERYRQTMLERYGVPYSVYNEESYDKYKQTMIEKYGCDCNWKRASVKAKAAENRKYHRISKVNVKFSQYLLSLGIETEFEKHLGIYYYDLVIEDKKIVIEINPTKTHNSYASIFSSKAAKSEDYHQLKTQTAEEFGYTCLHVWDWIRWGEIAYIIQNIEKVKFIKGSPEKVWSLSNKMIKDSESIDSEVMLEQGWLPVYTDGVEIIT